MLELKSQDLTCDCVWSWAPYRGNRAQAEASGAWSHVPVPTTRGGLDAEGQREDDAWTQGEDSRLQGKEAGLGQSLPHTLEETTLPTP